MASLNPDGAKIQHDSFAAKHTGYCIEISDTATDTRLACYSLAANGAGLLPGLTPDEIIASIPNLGEWWDPAFKITEDVNGISSWATRDDAGESLTLYQPTQSVRPVTSAGLVTFDGTQWMSGVAPVVDSPFTMFTVVDLEDTVFTSQPNDFVFGINNSSFAGWFVLSAVDLGSNIISVAANNGAGSIQGFELIPYTKAILRLTSGATDNFAVNNTQLGGAGSYTPPSTPDRFAIGKNPYIADRILSGKIGDIIFYNRELSVEENALVVGALSTKYAVTI